MILFRQVPLDEPAQYVAVHPLRWHDREHPTAAFVETDIDEDEIERLRAELRETKAENERLKAENERLLSPKLCPRCGGSVIETCSSCGVNSDILDWHGESWA